MGNMAAAMSLLLIVAPGDHIADRRRVLKSSRTLPGQRCFSKIFLPEAQKVSYEQTPAHEHFLH